MATTASRPRAGARSASAANGRRGSHAASGRPAPASQPTKAETKPSRTPEKAHKPGSAAAGRRPRKAHKPPSAATAPEPRRKSSRSARESSGSADRSRSASGSPKGAGKAVSAVAPKTAKALVKAASPGESSLAGHAGWKLVKLIAERTLSSGTGTLSAFSQERLERAAVAVGAIRQKAIAATSTSVEADTTRRPPIQAAVDAGVPARIAWQEWSRLQWLPEGVDSVIDVERGRDGELTGCLRGQEEAQWAARILDEREAESFAWESTRGSDCAGLITFHELAERLTRIELSLDVRPVSLAQAAMLSSRLADRRAATDLRRFKARLELISPDSYDDASDPQV